MRITATLLFLLLAATACGATFWVSYEVDRDRDRLAALGHDIMAERERIAVLRAELAHLTHPARLARLATSELGMQAMQTAGVIRLADLPLRQPLPDSPLAPSPEPEAPSVMPPALLTSFSPDTDTPNVPAPQRKPSTARTAVATAEINGAGRLDAVLRDLAFPSRTALRLSGTIGSPR